MVVVGVCVLRLYMRGVVMGYQRSRVNIYPSRSLVKIEEVKSKQEARYYLGHRVLYIYRSEKKKDPVTGKGVLKVIPGKITRTHGCNGTVRVRFTPNLPSSSHGKRCRVMLWPHKDVN